MNDRSRLVRMRIRNIGCIGGEGLEVALDDVVCLVGRNNAGKSTVLRAYELAYGGKKPFDSQRDRCIWAPAGEPAAVELDVHIPPGLGGVAEAWKIEEGDLRIVRSRWEWAPDASKSVRKTFDPSSGGWSDDGKAGGADNVFKSCLPKPLRVESLQESGKEHGELLKLALEPLMKMVEAEGKDSSSSLSKIFDDLGGYVGKKSAEHVEHFNRVAGRIRSGFGGVFPDLDLQLTVGMSTAAVKMSELLQNGSALQVSDQGTLTGISQQGSGARRALFWNILQVHNEIVQENENLEKSAKPKTRPKAAKGSKTDAPPEAPAEDSVPDLGLPGHILLIDEPENALHPMAARAAQRELYRLASSPNWQVMISTHSPYFVSPFEDHTTIVRLERSATGGQRLAPKTYRAADAALDESDKQRLQSLQHIDPSFAEVFFGSYPILVEGDTEHAAFIAAIVEPGHGLRDRVTVVRARGKAILVPLIKVLQHFAIDFGVVHDADWPLNAKKQRNGMWKINAQIHQAIQVARGRNVNVRHRVSVPDFERFLGGTEESKDKPIAAYRRVSAEVATGDRVRALVHELIDGERHDWYPEDALRDETSLLDHLGGVVAAWATEHGDDLERLRAGLPD